MGSATSLQYHDAFSNGLQFCETCAEGAYGCRYSLTLIQSGRTTDGIRFRKGKPCLVWWMQRGPYGHL